MMIKIGIRALSPRRNMTFRHYIMKASILLSLLLALHRKKVFCHLANFRSSIGPDYLDILHSIVEQNDKHIAKGRLC